MDVSIVQTSIYGPEMVTMVVVAAIGTVNASSTCVLDTPARPSWRMIKYV